MAQASQVEGWRWQQRLQVLVLLLPVACAGDWADLAAGGNLGLNEAENALANTVTRLANGSMPPVSSPKPTDPARTLMVEFLLDATR